MEKIRFAHADGREWSALVEDKESVMQAAVRVGVDGIIGECGGELSCGTCHVYVGDEARGYFPAAGADELDMLEVADDVTDESRLGCQLFVPADAGEITVVVP